MDRRLQGRAGWIAGLVLVTVALPGPLPAQEQVEEGLQIEPLDIGLVERTGIALMFLDVLAVDKEGRPMPGLTKDDFKIRVNYLPRKLYSVDNLCPCDDYGAELAVGQELPNEVTPAIARSTPVYVLYFDFSQLQIDGRVKAIEQAERWATETLRPGDRVMVVGHTNEAGVHRYTELTEDRDAVLRAIREADEDPRMVDTFPQQYTERLARCGVGDYSCYYAARQEYNHMRYSYRALRNFLTELDEIPERKIFLLFHQNNAIYPGRLYSAGSYKPTISEDFNAEDIQDYQRAIERSLGTFNEPGSAFGTTGDPANKTMLDGGSSDLVPDLLSLVDQVGGTATASRTMLFPAVAGYSQTWTVNVGANLADFTGGDFNRGPGGLTDLLDDAGRGCACIYRLGLIAPEGNKTKVYRTKVKVRGKALPARYRVQHLSPADRWVRRAQAVLSNPEQVKDVGVIAGLVPAKALDREWKLRAQVSVDANSLMRLQSGEEELGEWEVGALLVDGRGMKTWEMLAVSRLRVKEEESEDLAEDDDDGEAEDAIILHEHTFGGLKPGRYELRAFVRDRAAGIYGGDLTAIELPDVKETGLAGPVILRPEATHLRTSLPLRSKKNERLRWIATLETGSLPLGEARAEIGDELEFLTLACPARPKQVREQLRRSVVRTSDDGMLPLELGKIDRAGDCVEIRDRVDTAELTLGRYEYRVRWVRPGQDPLLADQGFEVVPETISALGGPE